MSHSDPMTMHTSLLPSLLHWLVLAAILVGVIIGMKRRPHWSCWLMLCGICAALLASVVGAVFQQVFLWRLWENRDFMQTYRIASGVTVLISTLAMGAFAAGFIVRMSIARRHDVPEFQPPERF